MEDDSSKRGVVIKGPWKKVVEQKIDKEIKKKFKGIPYCMISAIDEFGLTELKDLIWRILNTTDG